MGMGNAIVLLMAGVLICGLTVGAVVILLRRKGADAPMRVTDVSIVAERVRAVGKLVGLEVHAKEIATSTKGWSWIPPLVLSQAKVAMIFHFDKQYYVDLSKLRAVDVEKRGFGEYTIKLPPVEGSLRLSDLTPYDIQAGRVFALFDVIQMNAGTQKELISSAQAQASELFAQNEPRYVAEAQRAIERQIETLVSMLDIEIEIEWSESTSRADMRPELAPDLAAG